MKTIHCPKDIGIENTFSGSECVDEQNYNDCYHCWNTALARNIRPKGYWIDKGTHLECNRCGCLAPHTEFADAIFWKRSNYCPDCGADMREGEING